MNNITPQGYTYSIEPNTVHPFWSTGDTPADYTAYDITETKTIENVDKYFTSIELTCNNVNCVTSLPLLHVLVNCELFVPVLVNEKIVYLVCEGTSENTLTITSVLSTEKIEKCSIDSVTSTLAPIKGEKGDNGTDGVTPEITLTATVDKTSGTPSVTVTKGGSESAPTFNLAFTGLKGESGTDSNSDIDIECINANYPTWGVLEKQGENTLTEIATKVLTKQVTKDIYIDLSSIGDIECYQIDMSSGGYNLTTLTFDMFTKRHVNNYGMMFRVMLHAAAGKMKQSFDVTNTVGCQIISYTIDNILQNVTDITQSYIPNIDCNFTFDAYGARLAFNIQNFTVFTTENGSDTVYGCGWISEDLSEKNFAWYTMKEE